MTKKKIIIAGFPGIGKSTAHAISSDQIADLESSTFHWIVEKRPNGEKKVNPEWPYNYINHIKNIMSDKGAKYDKLEYILISTHKEVLQTLVDQKIPFIIVLPHTKEEFLKRYKNRGSSNSFIEQLDEHWDRYINDYGSYGMPIIMTDEYLYSILCTSFVKDWAKGKFDEIKNIDKRFNDASLVSMDSKIICSDGTMFIFNYRTKNK